MNYYFESISTQNPNSAESFKKILLLIHLNIHKWEI